MSEVFLTSGNESVMTDCELLQKYKKMRLDMLKFIDSLDEYLKKKSAELSTAERAKQLCAILGCVKVKLKNKNVKKEKCLVDIIDVMSLEKEISAFVSGARTEMIYAYQAFVEDFLNKDETEETEDDEN